MKRILNKGDIFSTWVVKECVDKAKYRFLCECNVCGKQKVFDKYNLLRGRYAVCKTCAPSSIKNVSKIRYHWNPELNGIPFTRIQDLKMDKPYWFICDKFHNFKSTIKDFSLSRCSACRGRERDSSNKIMIFDIAKGLFSSFIEVNYLDFWLVIPEVKLAIFFAEKDRDSNFRKYMSSEEEFLKYKESVDLQREEFENTGYSIFYFSIDGSLQENIENLELLAKNIVEQLDINDKFRYN